MRGKEIKSTLILSTLLTGCLKATPTPDGLGQANTDALSPAEILEDETLVKISFPDGAAIDLCSASNPYLGGTFVREDGELVFYLANDPRHTRFTFVKNEEFPFDDGLVVVDKVSISGRDDPTNPGEDFIQYDTQKWMTSCPKELPPEQFTT